MVDSLPTSPRSKQNSPQNVPSSYYGTSPGPFGSRRSRSERRSDLGSELGYGSFSGTQGGGSAPRDSSVTSYNQPLRSYHGLSVRGPLAPVNSQQNAENVRNATLTLADYALSESSLYSGSPSQTSIHQRNIDAYFPHDESESGISRTPYDPQDDVIVEVSEPTSPIFPAVSPGRKSNLTELIKRSPPSTHPSSPPRHINSTQLQGESVRLQREEEIPHFIITGQEVGDPLEDTPLLKKDYPNPSREIFGDESGGEEDIESHRQPRISSWRQVGQYTQEHLEEGLNACRILANPRTWDPRAIWDTVVVTPASCLPAVLLGLLLNILDALSYGMILFPLGQPIFEKLGPAGISMFYVSTIISQLVYSCGASSFRGGVGSEMIEVVPFFHAMTGAILNRVGEENPDVVLSTTVTAYAMSSILTGAVFLFMGIFRMGYIVGFIPRHILTGCIGGVGFFLIVTGFEITARLDGNLEYNWETAQKMLRSDTIPLWLIPMTLGVTLYVTEKELRQNYTFLASSCQYWLFSIFSFILWISSIRLLCVVLVGYLTALLQMSRGGFSILYTMLDFNLVDWGAILDTIPSMFALTFFGILHVPINVPALAFACGMDHVDVDRELIAHGISNGLSGCFGSIQNYLVYANSVVFMKGGGDSRLAGIMLAMATFGVMLIGPVIIGYIPVMVVGVLIFALGIDLLWETITDGWHKMKWLEFLTVVAIVLIMGIYDFVAGVAAGIMLAFVSFVYQVSQVPAVRSTFTGQVAGSTVRRHIYQRQYLQEVGRQVQVTKLAGFLFFGTIVKMEEEIRQLVDDDTFQDRPIRYLIFDFGQVTGLDYSAAEAFTRLNRIFSKKGVHILMCGISWEDPVGASLRSVGLGEGEEGGNKVELLDSLNSALEGCENELLTTLYRSEDAHLARAIDANSTETNPGVNTLDVPYRRRTLSNGNDFLSHSPRQTHLQEVAHKTVREGPAQPRYQSRYHNLKPCLKLMLQAFTGLTEKNHEDFWFPLVPFFEMKEYKDGEVLFERGDVAKGFYLIENGILRADYDLPQGHYSESMVTGTTCGELPFFSETDRTARVTAEKNAVVWILEREKWDELKDKHPDIASELMVISLKLTSERMESVTRYVLTTAA